MKAFFDKYKYILGLGLALVAVVIIAVVSAAMGKDAAENSGISYVTPETSSFTTVESLVSTTAFKQTAILRQRPQQPLRTFLQKPYLKAKSRKQRQ